MTSKQTYALPGVIWEERFEEAAAALEICLNQSRDARVLNDLAWANYKLGELKRARLLAQEAVELRPDVAGIWDTLGKILAKHGDHTRAGKVFEKAVELSDSKDGLILLHYAQFLDQTSAQSEVVYDVLRTISPRREVWSGEDFDAFEALVEKYKE